MPDSVIPPKALRISVEPVLEDTTEIQIQSVTNATELTFDVAPLEDNVKVERSPSPLGGDTDTASENSEKPDEEIQVTQASTVIPVTNVPMVSQYIIGYITVSHSRTVTKKSKKV